MSNADLLNLELGRGSRYTQIKKAWFNSLFALINSAMIIWVGGLFPLSLGLTASPQVSSVWLAESVGAHFLCNGTVFL